jgi:hypothetical protein
MKKLLLGSLLAVVAAFGLSAAEPIGIDLGLDVGIYGFESDIGLSLDPSIAYNRTVAGIDASATLDYAFPIYEEYVDGVIGLELYGSKSFALSDTLNVVPGLTIAYAYDTNAEEDESSFGIEPEATLEYGNYYGLLSLPIGFVPDSAFDIYLEVGGSFGDLSAYVSGDYAVSPDAQLAAIGLGVEYPYKAFTFGADGEFTGFGEDEDVVYAQTLSVTYSF